MLLHKILQIAVRKKFLPDNPADTVENKPENRVLKIRTLDEEKVKLFLGEARRSSPYYRLYLTALLTGLRAGQLLGLRWGDVKPDGSATIERAFYRLGGSKKEGRPTQMLFNSPKSKKVRTVALPPLLVEELRALRVEQNEQRKMLCDQYYDYDHDLVFCQANGKPLHLNDLRRGDFRSVLKRGPPADQVPRPTPYCRHT